MSSVTQTTRRVKRTRKAPFALGLYPQPDNTAPPEAPSTAQDAAWWLEQRRADYERRRAEERAWEALNDAHATPFEEHAEAQARFELGLEACRRDLYGY